MIYISFRDYVYGLHLKKARAQSELQLLFMHINAFIFRGLTRKAYNYFHSVKVNPIDWLTIETPKLNVVFNGV
jgi:hypothetical protein